MRYLVVALAAAALAFGTPLGAAQAAGSGEPGAHYTVLTPEQAGLTTPGQGFFPFFVGQNQGGTTGNGVGLGGLAPTILGASAIFNGQGGCGIFSAGFCPFFGASPFTNTFICQGTIGLGGPTTTGLGGLFGNTGLFGAGTGLGLGTGFGLGANVLGANVTGNVFGIGLNTGLFGGGLGFSPFLTGGTTGALTGVSVFTIGPGGALIRIR
jgi:hypothetical protein